MIKGQTLVAKYPNKCIWCGNDFVSKLQRAKYCSKECRDHEMNKLNIEYTYKCEWCNDTFTTKRQNVRYCSRQCSSMASRKRRGVCRYEPYKLKCEYCGVHFENKVKAKYCSKSCKDKAKYYRDKEIFQLEHPEVLVEKEQRIIAKEQAKQLKEQQKLQRLEEQEKKRAERKAKADYYKNYEAMHICNECGIEFTAFYPDKKYCSKKCSRRAGRKRRPKAPKHLKRFADDKIIDRDINLKDLYEKDKGICWLCNTMCDYTDFFVDSNGTTICGDNYPSIDHVIPRAKGGMHSWENVRLAHRRCNYMKSDRVM